MKLIIDIPEEDYIRLRDEGMFGNVTTFKRAVREGIPLEQACEDAIKHFKNVYELSQTLSVSYDFVDEKIQEMLMALKTKPLILSPVTPQPKMGRWVYNKNLSTHYGDVYTCSECGERCLESCYERIEKLPDFCPKCHAKMGVEE